MIGFLALNRVVGVPSGVFSLLAVPNVVTAGCRSNQFSFVLIWWCEQFDLFLSYHDFISRSAGSGLWMWYDCMSACESFFLIRSPYSSCAGVSLEVRFLVPFRRVDVKDPGFGGGWEFVTSSSCSTKCLQAVCSQCRSDANLLCNLGGVQVWLKKKSDINIVSC